MSEFVRMGGDGAYVWSAYGITLAVLLANAWMARRKRREALERARAALGEAPAPRNQPTVRRLQ